MVLSSVVAPGAEAEVMPAGAMVAAIEVALALGAPPTVTEGGWAEVSFAWGRGGP